MTSPWRRSWRADPAVAALADRHYNRQHVGAGQFVPPGSCLVLKTADGKAGWVTHLHVFQQLPDAMPDPAPIPGSQIQLWDADTLTDASSCETPS